MPRLLGWLIRALRRESVEAAINDLGTVEFDVQPAVFPCPGYTDGFKIGLLAGTPTFADVVCWLFGLICIFSSHLDSPFELSRR